MYELLHYPGDVTKIATLGRLLGENEFAQPFEIIDSEYDPESNMTTVRLQLSHYGE